MRRVEGEGSGTAMDAEGGGSSTGMNAEDEGPGTGRDEGRGSGTEDGVRGRAGTSRLWQPPPDLVHN